MAVLALDLGAVRVGIALNPVGTVILELPTITYGSENGLVADIGALVAENSVTTLVVGSATTDQAELLTVKLAEKLEGVHIVVLDESLSTKEAERQLAAEGRPGDSDARAARLLLEQYLENHTHG